jgi:hypothetical protein
MVSVGWDGQLYDCDFNQMLDLPIQASGRRKTSPIQSHALESRSIVWEPLFWLHRGPGIESAAVPRPKPPVDLVTLSNRTSFHVRT